MATRKIRLWDRELSPTESRRYITATIQSRKQWNARCGKPYPVPVEGHMTAFTSCKKRQGHHPPCGEVPNTVRKGPVSGKRSVKRAGKGRSTASPSRAKRRTERW